MNIIDINNIIREAEKESGDNFKDLFSESQQNDIINLLEEIDKKIKS